MAIGRTNAKGSAASEGNYAMLFYRGDQADKLTGGYTVVCGPDDRPDIEYGPDLLMTGQNGGYLLLRSNQRVDMSLYEKLFCYSREIGRSGSSFLGVYTTEEVEAYSTSSSGAPGTSTTAGSQTKLHLPFTGTGIRYVVSKKTGDQYVYLCAGSNARIKISAVWLAGADDWMQLCNILGLNSGNFADEQAMMGNLTVINTLLSSQYGMEYLRSCTGTVLAGFISNNYAMDMLRRSPYFPMLCQDPHWGKFLAMME